MSDRSSLEITANFSSYLTILQILFFFFLGMYLGIFCCSQDSQICNVRKKKKKRDWDVQPSKIAKCTRNYIREVVENLNLIPNPQKEVIALSIGDPSTYGNILFPKELKEAVLEAATSAKFNGYADSLGHKDTRQAVAEYMSYGGGARYEYNDIVLFNGCSGAIEHCILLLGEKDDNIIIPKPGFPFFRTIAEGIGIKCKFYNLLPEKNWIVDIANLESQIDNNSAAIIVINPSNPCGSVYKANHLRAILNVASKHKIPIIADEIHARIVYGETFVSIATLGSDVPLFICSGISKMLVVPGWRLGWIAIHDPRKNLEPAVRKGLQALSTINLGPCTLIQGALIKSLNQIPESYYEEIRSTLRMNGRFCYDCIENIKGLNPLMPAGAYYMMIEIKIKYFPAFSNTTDFTIKLMEEESVFCLPGECFGIPNYIRIVISPPAEILREACKRIKEFCERHGSV